MDPISIKIKGEEHYQRLLGGPPDTIRLKSGAVTLGPGESVGEHNTDSKEEAIIVLSGKAEISCGAQPVIVAEKNTLTYIPPGTRHDVRNTSNNMLVYIYVVSIAE